MDTEREYSLDDLKRDAEREMAAWFMENHTADESDADEQAREIADSHTPVYTHDLLMYAANTLWLATVEPEVMAFDGENTASNAIAGNIYEELRTAAYEEWERLHEESAQDSCWDCGEPAHGNACARCDDPICKDHTHFYEGDGSDYCEVCIRHVETADAQNS